MFVVESRGDEDGAFNRVRAKRRGGGDGGFFNRIMNPFSPFS